MTITNRRLKSKAWLTRHVRHFRGVGRAVTLADRRPLTIFFSLLAIGLLADIFDSFGLDDASETAWSGVVSGVAGPLYGERFGDLLHRPAPARVGQRKIAIVLIDDRTLADNDLEGPPLSYAAQSKVLQEVAAADPRAIFWDVHYPRGRLVARTIPLWDAADVGATGPDPGMADLARTMAEIGKHRPLLIGPIGPPPKPIQGQAQSDPLAPIRALLAPAAATVRRGVRQVSIRTGPTDTRNYPLWPPATGNGAGLPPAAIALYNAYCATAPTDQAGSACPHGMVQPSRRPMVVQWGLGVSRWRESQLPEKQSKQCLTGESPLRNVVSYVWKGLTRAWPDSPDGQTANIDSSAGDDPIDDRTAGLHCGYHDLVYAANLAQIDATSGAPLAAVLKDRIVLVGFDLPGLGDRRQVPFYGDVPGVFVHAMAVDNLLESSGRPAMAPGDFVLGLNQLDALQWAGVALGILTSLLLSRKSRAMFRIRDTKRHRHEAVAGLVAVLLALIAGITLLYGYILDWPFSTVAVSGLIPGGIVGTALIFLSRAGARRGGGHAKPVDD